MPTESRPGPAFDADGPVTAGALADALGGVVVGDASRAVTGVQQDSRAVKDGDLFVALAGATVDAAAYVPKAAAAGAVAVLAEPRAFDAAGLPVIEVPEARLAMAEAAAIVYGRPTEAMEVVGITGTNGKTTSARMTHHALSAAGARPGIIGTLGYRFEDLDLPSSHTSPESDALQRLARTMRERGASHLVMEVSSIALDTERVASVRFAVGAFTNLTQDHLDHHGSMEAYAAAKERLFFEHAPRVSVINVDDPHGAKLASRLPEALRVSLRSDADAQVRATRLVQDHAGTRLEIATPRGPRLIEAPIVGAHNAQNLIVAQAIVEALELDGDRAAASLGNLPPVDGRMERCDRPGVDDVVAVVDYAHTPDALARVLESLAPLAEGGRLWCVFGCGGDRDRRKRAPMGAVVARLADVAIVTNDNPRTEDPETIAAAVVEGVRSEDGATLHVELDRRKAIRHAIDAARAGDVICVAGKGHETYQIIGGRAASFDDRVEVRDALARRRGEGR